MTKEELKQQFLNLGKREGIIQNIEDVYDAFLKSLELPIESIYDLDDLEEYDDSKDFACYYVWAYTHKCEYQICFTLNKKQKNVLEEKKEYVNQLLDKIEKEEKRKIEEENQKFLNLQNKILNLCSQLNKELGETLGRINKKYIDLELGREIFNYGTSVSFKITLRGDKFYLTRNICGNINSVYWEFENKDIQELKNIFNDNPKDFNEQEIVNSFYELLDKLIKKLEKEYN